MIKKQSKNDKGFTLIEGLVALAILAIFIPVFYSLSSYIDRTFSISNRQSDLQFYSRLAKIKIEKEIQFATFLEIRSDVPSVTGIQRAIYVEDGRIKMKTYNADENVEVESDFLSNVPDDVTMSLAFEKMIENNTDGKNIFGDCLLGFTITTSSSGDTVDLDSSLLINRSTADFIINGTSGNAILYIKP